MNDNFQIFICSVCAWCVCLCEPVCVCACVQCLLLLTLVAGQITRKLVTSAHSPLKCDLSPRLRFYSQRIRGIWIVVKSCNSIFFLCTFCFFSLFSRFFSTILALPSDCCDRDENSPGGASLFKKKAPGSGCRVATSVRCNNNILDF